MRLLAGGHLTRWDTVFQAINPQLQIYDADSHHKTMRAFSETVLNQHPLSKPADALWVEKLHGSVTTAAGQRNITVQALHD